MLEQLKQQSNLTVTENGAAAYRTTGSDCLDLFAAVGGMRRAPEEDIICRFQRAFAESPDLAMKILFFARDIRGGLGERRLFRVILRWLAFYHPASVKRNLPQIAEYGRFDDLLCLLDTPCEEAALKLIGILLRRDCAALEKDDSVSLLAKWLPSVNASNTETVKAAKRIARSLGMTDAEYRKILVKLRAQIRILENNLRLKDYSFDYAKQPSRAMLKYRKAFLRRDPLRYNSFLQQVSEGKSTLHTEALAPYDIIRPMFNTSTEWSFWNLTPEQRHAIDVTWKAQQDFTNGENALVVVDGSGSMYWQGGDPIQTALSLGIYFAERNTGAFRNHFITFSKQPQLIEIKGEDIYDKVFYCAGYNKAANTDLDKVFQLILDTAIRYQLPQEELPSTLYLISDMEFDGCVGGADQHNFEYAKQQFAAHGYRLPRVVFWNVASRHGHQPVTMNEQGVALVSGSSPRIFSMLQNGSFDPYQSMMEILGSERYAAIAA